jgi:starch synthase
MIRTWESFRYKPEWQALQRRAMTMDFSWTTSAKQYDKLYRDLLGIPDPAIDEVVEESKHDVKAAKIAGTAKS